WQARGLAWSSSLTLASPDFHRLKWGALLIAASIPLAIHLSSRSAVMLAISIAVYLWSEQWAGVLSAGVVFAALELLLARLDSANLPLPSLNAYLHAAFGMILSASFILV